MFYIPHPVHTLPEITEGTCKKLHLAKPGFGWRLIIRRHFAPFCRHFGAFHSARRHFAPICRLFGAFPSARRHFAPFCRHFGAFHSARRHFAPFCRHFGAFHSARRHFAPFCRRFGAFHSARRHFALFCRQFGALSGGGRRSLRHLSTADSGRCAFLPPAGLSSTGNGNKRRFRRFFLFFCGIGGNLWS